MVTVNIPESAKPIIERLTTMSEAEVSAIKTAIEQVPLSLRAEKHSKQLKSVAAKENRGLEDVVQVIATLAFAPRDPAISVRDLAKALASVVVLRPGRTQQEPTEIAATQALLEQRLQNLLDTPALKIYSRASDVQHQYEHILIEARIMSDIRTVFDPAGDGSKVEGAMIVHTLKISHISNRSNRESYFAMDNADLVILQKAISRALKKTESLEKIISNSGLRYFESK